MRSSKRLIARLEREVNPPQVAAAEPEPRAEPESAELEAPRTAERRARRLAGEGHDAPSRPSLTPSGRTPEHQSSVEEAIAAGDDEPMSVAHEESPVRGAGAGFTAAAFEVEAPEGMHVEEAPLDAEVADAAEHRGRAGRSSSRPPTWSRLAADAGASPTP